MDEKLGGGEELGGEEEHRKAVAAASGSSDERDAAPINSSAWRLKEKQEERSCYTDNAVMPKKGGGARARARARRARAAAARRREKRGVVVEGAHTQKRARPLSVSLN